MSPQARDATIKLFMENPRTTVFLVSLKAGGVALNLTEASRVFLMDVSIALRRHLCFKFGEKKDERLNQSLLFLSLLFLPICGTDSHGGTQA